MDRHEVLARDLTGNYLGHVHIARGALSTVETMVEAPVVKIEFWHPLIVKTLGRVGGAAEHYGIVILTLAVAGNEITLHYDLDESLEFKGGVPTDSE